MIHLVCDCGALVSTPPAPGPRDVPCRECGKAVRVPDAAALGLETKGGAVPPAPAPVPVPLPLPPDLPRFDADERLDLVVLEREAARLLVMGRMSAAAGAVGVGAAAILPGVGEPTRVLLGAGILFAAVAAWTLFRGARAACLASVALAQRQREILRRLA